MEIIKDSEFIHEILSIDDISGDNQIFNITFKTREREFYRLTFNSTWDLHYSVEMANVTRFGGFKGKEERTSDISLIENSEYIKSLDDTFVEVYKLNDLVHYVITDASDTVVDVITDESPVIERIEQNDYIQYLEQEIIKLKWWKGSENISAVQKELEELREYKLKREQEDKKAREDEIARNSFGF